MIPERATAALTIDLDALVGNWRKLRARMAPERASGIDCAAVLKADAYGTGARQALPALVEAGCRTFFVAQVDEALTLLDLLPESVRIFVLSGPPPGGAAEMVAHGVIPVLNSPDQIATWGEACSKVGRRLPCALHVDTGMTRLGLSWRETQTLIHDRSPLAAMEPVLLMSHLACADEPNHPLNAQQLATFQQVSRAFPQLPASLANSSGLFLDPAFRFELGRPGIALYGGNPTAGAPNPMGQVVRLQGKILQIRQIDTPCPVGYGATHHAGAGRRLATVGVGYADGYPRAAGNRSMGRLGGWPVPLVGRVSMDLITFDVTDAPERLAHPGGWIELIGPGHGVDDLADECDAVGYEILTRLGSRYPRTYLFNGGTQSSAGQGNAP
ncbi:alanine racemase [Rhodospirillum sp. A1_3_36]|uniref:alanine racemase n=1 Tax=Rhodospirillum sp. A1_3_36 TaxID=3391666 RepID=UPI0039A4F112